MKNWIIKEEWFNNQEITANENRFLCGNGYLGIRGALEEFQKEKLPAVNLSGIYDRVGDGWREPLNAPNPLYTRIKVDGEYYFLSEKEPVSHIQELDFRHGIVRRLTTFRTKRGCVTVEAEHFASMADCHLIGMRYTVTADFHADIEIHTGIDGDVWDIHGPHYDEVVIRQKDMCLVADAVTHENREHVCVAERYRTQAPHEHKTKEEERRALHRICVVTDINKPVVIEKMAAVYTTKDCSDPEMVSEKVVTDSMEAGYEEQLKRHTDCWERLWDTSEVEIEGDAEAEKELNYSIYHLLSIAPYHAKSQSIPARGLSGQTYKGAVFWDTEMFMLDFFLNTQPKVARTLLKYRIDTLAGAEKKAKDYGYEGAFYAWESQEGGYDACSDYNVTDVFTNRPMRTYFKDKQIHISGAVVYGLIHYVNLTGDTSILYEGGAETVVSCARFYDSRMSERVHSEVYELRDVIGPDEYHERVNNNGYTNRMARFVLMEAAKLLNQCKEDRKLAEVFRKMDVGFWEKRFDEDAKKIIQKEPEENGIIEQFDGYFQLEDTTVDTVRSRLLNEKEYWGGAYGVASDTQIIKQADVVTQLVMFPEDFSKQIAWKNWNYYEPRTEHGSSLSACMYGILACSCGYPNAAYPFFRKSAEADLKGGGKEWAGMVYIGGTHPAAAGGAYMTAIKGFAGITIENDRINAHPSLPDGWKKMKFSMFYRGELYEVHITSDGVRIGKRQPLQN